MEENTAAVECLIRFYINMKYVLKTKQLVERVFIDEMIKYCNESGFKYSGEEIKETWRNVVSKYQSLKCNGTPEGKGKWKHFDIFDSCFELADFHSSSSPKFSDEMVWFLIECFLKRKALRKTHKHSSIVNEIYKEFVQCGYLYITKQDIDNKWRHLNLKYEKLKNNPESLKKWPYLQALKGFHQESGRHVVNMVFTRELTEILIERFTEKKVTCVIHGYDSDQVLGEIQSEFKDLGFFFPKDDIKEKWKDLTNIYKFLLAKGNKDTSWIYFDAMKNHFKDDFSLSWSKTNKKNEVKGKRMRQRSKSVGPEIVSKRSMTPNLIVQLEKVSSLHHLKLKDEDKVSPSKQKSLKRSSSEHRRIKSRKKLKIRRRSDTTQTTDGNENKIQSNEISSGNVTYFQTNAHLQKSFTESQERRSSIDLASPTSKVHIINIDHSEIDRNSGNLTINLPSITKQFSDNEFLPLKKRLRVEGENISIDSGTSNKITEGFLGFPTTQSATQKVLGEGREDKRLTEEEMSEIVERIEKETARNYDTSNKEFSANRRGIEQYQNYQNMYPELNQRFILPKVEQQEGNVQSYSGPGAVPQPPVLLLVIKVDGSNNTAKESTPGEDNAKTGTCSVQNSPKKADEAVEKRTNDTQKQISEGVTPPQVFNDFVKPISPKGKTIVISNKKKLVPFRMDSKIDGCNSEVIVTEQVAVNSTDLNKNASTKTSNTGNISIEEKTMRNKSPQREKVEETAATKTEVTSKPKISETIVPSQAVKPIVSTGKIRLPVKEAGGLKQIFISPSELNKIKSKPQNVKLKTYDSKKPGDGVIRNSQEKKFKFISQVVRPATRDCGGEKIANPRLNFNNVVDQSIEDNPLVSPQPYKAGSKFSGWSGITRNTKNKEFDNESVLSEGIWEDEVSKDNLLATVIDFQEQNNQEFIEIKNLMKQNNLLQRETNRLLRLMLEKH